MDIGSIRNIHSIKIFSYFVLFIREGYLFNPFMNENDVNKNIFQCLNTTITR